MTRTWRVVPMVLAVGAGAARAQVPAGPEFTVAGSRTMYADAAQVAVLGDGGFVIAWTDLSAADGSASGVFARTFGRDGLPLSAAFQVNSYTTGNQAWAYPAGLAASRDGFVVTWFSDGQDGHQGGVFGQRFDGSGARRGAEFRVNTTWQFHQSSPAVAMAPDGRFIVVWTLGFGYQGTFAQRYSASGDPAGGEFMVAGNALSPQVAMDAQGGFVVVWSNQCGRISGQRFDASGGRLGGEFLVNTDTSEGACANGPDVASAPDGRFVVTWKWFRDDGFIDLAGRAFDAAGNPVGAELQVNADTLGNQYSHSVAMDGRGRFVVTWGHADFQENQGHQIKLRLFDAEGRPLTPDVQASTSRSFVNGRPVVSADALGNFVIAFDWRFVDHAEVRARRYLGGVVPALLAVDASAGPSSDGNGVLEACESVSVRPAWHNETEAPLVLSGSLSGFSGPEGATYTIVDGEGSYGSVASGATGSCTDCYAAAVSCATPRPATHWDALLTEGLAPIPQVKPWSLHVGESFSDVARTSPYYRFVEVLLHHSITAGCAADRYCPGTPITRGQMPVFLLAAKEGPAYSAPHCFFFPSGFADVPMEHPFCAWISALARRGVVSGCGGGNYCPDAPVTREQMAVFVLRTLEPTLEPPPCQTPLFDDVPASNPFCRWIEELARRGVVTGCGGGNYCPAAAVTREQMAVFLTTTFGFTLYGATP